ncbi:MAG TPA: hypothetical protein VEN82_07735, partial [Actinomycetota bacterium]|nr:hypothetical protein [Actinomycetota bacterium]
RALASGRSTGSVAFAFRAVDGAGRSATLPAGGNGTPLRFYVVPSFRTVRMPVVPFGHVSKGETVLSLPWGTGSSRAGLVLGNESPTLGPSSFDVDARGGIYLLDGLQDRLAVFSGGRLVRETRLPASSQYDVAVAGDGTAFVLSRREGRTVAFRVDPSGSLSGTFDLGDVVPSEIRAVGGGAAVKTLPVDAWRTLGPRGLEPGLDTGRPLSDGGQLLTVARPNEVRLATLRGAVVSRAVRIGSSAALGELGLAEPDGKGGYVVVVHVWRQEPTPADQYEVVHVASGGRVTAFGVPNAAFAQTAALSKFRLGADGTLYELTSSPDGMRIVRFQIGGNR